MNEVLQFLTGVWFICATNFPMWLKGDKTAPTFHYDIREKGILNDEVRYLKKGKEKSIRGFDYQEEKDATRFVWRGKGALRLLKSKWRVALTDPNGEWAVIHFSKTLFTPEGLDIIGRNKDLSVETLESIKQVLMADSLLKEQVPSLKLLYHTSP